MSNEYPKTMQSSSGQSVVVANEDQEKALPKDYGGKAAGKSYAEQTAEQNKPAPPAPGPSFGQSPTGPGSPQREQEKAQRLHDESVVGDTEAADAMEDARDKNKPKHR